MSTRSSKRSKSYSKIIKGATVRKQADRPSIPTRYQRVLVDSNQERNRFSKKYELQKLFNTAPGPGTYEHKKKK